MDDQFADQAVVVGRDGIAVIKRAIHAHAKTTRCVELRDPAGAGREIRQLFRVDPHFNRVAGDFQIVLCERHRQTGCDTDLFAHEVLIENSLGHRVFDLKAGVHFNEIKLAIFVQKFDCPSTDIVDACTGIRTDLADCGAFLGRNRRPGRFFEYFLVAALQGTITFPQMHCFAFTVAKHLNFDVARCGQVLFNIDVRIAEIRLTLSAGCLKGGLHLIGGIGDLHALTTAASRGFDDDRIAKFFADF